MNIAMIYACIIWLSGFGFACSVFSTIGAWKNRNGLLCFVYALCVMVNFIIPLGILAEKLVLK